MVEITGSALSRREEVGAGGLVGGLRDADGRVELISHITIFNFVALTVCPLVALRWLFDIYFDFQGRWFTVATDTGTGEETHQP